MAFAAFGPGILIVTRTDLTTPLAINVGYAQELTIDFAGNTKSLYGQKQFPLVAARSTIKATGKWKSAAISGICWNAAFFGGTLSAGGLQWAIDSTAPGSTLGVSVPNSSVFDADLGVTYSTKGLPLQRVSTLATPTVGQYNVTSTGFYMFAAADATLGMNFTYSYGAGTGSGQTLLLTNPNIGNTPTFQLDYYTSLNQPTAKPFIVRLYQNVGEKMAMAFKLEDFMMPEFDFNIFADASNRVFNISYPEVG